MANINVFIVSLPAGAAPIVNGVDSFVVYATSQANARIQAAGYAVEHGYTGNAEAFGAADTQQLTDAGAGVWGAFTKQRVLTSAEDNS